MFICGNNDNAKQLVAEICKNFGWGVIDIGGIEGSRYLEPMCMVWLHYGIRNKSWNHAFKMLRK
jgi:predicted dinucleotide-binding enzyme